MEDLLNKLTHLLVGKKILSNNARDKPILKIEYVKNPYVRFATWSNIHDRCEMLFFEMRYLTRQPFTGAYDTVDMFVFKWSDIEPILTASDESLDDFDTSENFYINGQAPYGDIRIEVKNVGTETLKNI